MIFPNNCFSLSSWLSLFDPCWVDSHVSVFSSSSPIFHYKRMTCSCEISRFEDQVPTTLTFLKMILPFNVPQVIFSHLKLFKFMTVISIGLGRAEVLGL